jgi:U5 snRNP spliceosome subunit
MYGIPSNINYPPMAPPPPPPPQTTTSTADYPSPQLQGDMAGSYASRSAQAYNTAAASGATTIGNNSIMHNQAVPGNVHNNSQWNPIPAPVTASADYPYPMTTMPYPTSAYPPQPQQQPPSYGLPPPHSSGIHPPQQPFLPPPAQTFPSDPQAFLLQQSVRRMQEAMHIMRGAMEANDLSTTLDRANAMLGELGDPKHHHHHSHGYQHHHHGYSSPMSHTESPKAVMSPKHYYELHMMAMDELPNLEEYFLSIASPDSPEGSSIPRAKFTMQEIYQIVQFSPRAVPRLYLMICAGSALLRSGEGNVHNVLRDLKDAVKCVQCPIRGLFLRHYLLQAVKDKLPDERRNKCKRIE